MLEDYTVLLLGAAAYKIGRLLFVAMLSVHLFACAFHRIKHETASEADAEAFYRSKNVDPLVIRFTRIIFIFAISRPVGEKFRCLLTFQRKRAGSRSKGGSAVSLHQLELL